MNDDLQLLIDAAKASAEIARGFYRDDPEVWDKGDGAGPVTEADLAIDTMLRSELLANRSGYGWLSEETEDTEARLSREHVFIVDPIDGTRAFIAGERSWSHSLAIAENGRVTTAVVYVPMMDMLYTATDDTQSELNGSPIKASTQKSFAGATVLAAKPAFADKHWADGAPAVSRHCRPSLAYRLCLVAQGRFDAMLTLRDCWEWDIAAGELIVRQAGGQATDMANCPLVFNRDLPKTAGCIAAGRDLHAKLQGKLRRDGNS